MGYECRTREFSTKLGVAFFLLLVLAAVAVVNGTPFDVPGRTLASQHKQMRYQPFSTLQAQQILAQSGSFTFRVSSQSPTPQYFHSTSFWVILVKSKVLQILQNFCYSYADDSVSFSIIPCNTQIPVVVLLITLAIWMLSLLLLIKQKQALNFTQGVECKPAIYVVH
jgi:hypothetical protein